MSFLTSLSGLKAAQTDLSVVSNNIANGNSTGFKKSRASFGDLFAASPTQATKKIAGQGVQLQGQPCGAAIAWCAGSRLPQGTHRCVGCLGDVRRDEDIIALVRKMEQLMQQREHSAVHQRALSR